MRKHVPEHFSSDLDTHFLKVAFDVSPLKSKVKKNQKLNQTRRCPAHTSASVLHQTFLIFSEVADD